MIIELKSRNQIDQETDFDEEQSLLESVEMILDQVGYKAYEYSRSKASYHNKQKMRREIQLKMDHMKYTIEKTMCMALGE